MISIPEEGAESLEGENTEHKPKPKPIEDDEDLFGDDWLEENEPDAIPVSENNINPVPRGKRVPLSSLIVKKPEETEIEPKSEKEEETSEEIDERKKLKAGKEKYGKKLMF